MFSIGEMTAHPKYYSFIGLVAPQDRKAVYMGYAFLYGVFGSLLGSNIGSYLYALMIEPVLHTDAVAGRSTAFWLLFAALDICAALGLIMFFRKFGTDTSETRRSAARTMVFAYSLIGALGLAFLVLSFGGESSTVPYHGPGGNLSGSRRRGPLVQPPRRHPPYDGRQLARISHQVS